MYRSRSLGVKLVLLTVILAVMGFATGCGVGAAASGTTPAPDPVALSLSPATVTLQTGATQQFTASVTGSANTAVTWNLNGGSISAAGMYTAPNSAGTYKITATSVADATKSASATVTVAAAPAVSVSINLTLASLAPGGTQQFLATVTGSTNTAVTWTATGGTIAASGLYTAPATTGTYTVKATSAADPTKSASATVTVAAIAVSISPLSAALQTGATQQFTAAVTGSTNTAIIWTATAGTVSTTGLYTAPGAAGTYTVTATSVADNTKSASATVTVTATPPPVAVSVSPSSASIQTGATQQFTATVTGSTNTAVTWSATAGTISTAGLYTAPAAAGSYTLKATSVADSTKSASATVTVTAPPPVAVSIIPTVAAIQTGATQQFTATVTGSTNTAVTWSASGGTISTSGLYTAPATAGSYVVTATSVADTTKSASATITVTATPPPVAVSVSPTSASIQTGATQQFTATVTGSSNTAVTWSATGGTISTSGLYTAPATAGSYTVKATSVADSTKSASVTVTVNAAPAQITVSPTSLSFGSIVVNNSANLTVQISNTGGSAMSVTNATVTGTSFSLVSVTFPISVPAGQSTTLTAKFAPTATGTFTGTLLITSNAPNTPPTVALTGTATAAPTFLLGASPASISFGNVLVGSSGTQTVTLSNSGTGSISVSAANVTGTGFAVTGLTLPASIAAGATKQVTLTFSPGTSGGASGSVSFVSNATNSPATVSLSGSGTAPLPHSADLTWAASTSPVVGYYVYRSTVSGGPYVKLNTVAEATTSYTDSTVTSGATYYYVVTAVDSTGVESAYSNQATAVIPTP